MLNRQARERLDQGTWLNSDPPINQSITKLNNVTNWREKPIGK